MLSSVRIETASRVHQMVANKLESCDFDEHMMLPAFQKIRGNDFSEEAMEKARSVISMYRTVLNRFPNELGERDQKRLKKVEQLYEGYFYREVYGV